MSALPSTGFGVRGRVSPRYVVVGSHVTDRDDSSVTEPSDDSRLTLVTCYPFDAVAAGTTERFVVVAERQDAARAGKS